jgi:hypothetical protein
MALPVIAVPNGIAVRQATGAIGGLPVTVSTGFGLGVTPVATGGLAVTDTTGTLFGPAVIPANLTPPVISGTTTVGQTLVTTSGTWSGTLASYTYQWKRGGVNIAGATGNSYTLVTADLGATITVTVTATNPAGSASATAAGVGPIAAAAGLPAPVLDLITASDTGPSSTDNITADTTPDLDITFPSGAFAGDIVKIYDGGSLIGSHTITSGEALAAAFTLGLSALANGTHPLTATLTRGASVSATSATLSITIDPTAVTPTGFSWWRLSVSVPSGGGNAGLTFATLEFREAGVNKATGGTGFAGSAYAGHDVGLAFDGNSSTEWWSNFSNTWPQIIGYHFTAATAVTSIGVMATGSVDTLPGNFLLQHSVDTTNGLDGTWVTQSTITGLTSASYTLGVVKDIPTP